MYTFVTVAFRGERGLLRLQARSMDRYLPPDLVTEIIVIDNPTAGFANPSPGRPTRWYEALRPDYGVHAPIVRFVRTRDLVDLPPWAGGWWVQQMLKLIVSRLVTTTRYVVLDAKNHLVSPLELGFLEVGEKIRSARVGFRDHPNRAFFDRTVSYFGLDPEAYVDTFLPTITPFTFPTHVVGALVDYVELREQKPFALAMLELEVTEFFLFTSFIIATEMLDELYDLSGVECPTIWDHNADEGPSAIAKLITQSDDSDLPFFAVHRKAFPKLSESARFAIAEFWCRRCLFGTVSEGVAFLLDPNRPPRRSLRRKKR